jgi:hypothetical protein
VFPAPQRSGLKPLIGRSSAPILPDLAINKV